MTHERFPSAPPENSWQCESCGTWYPDWADWYSAADCNETGVGVCLCKYCCAAAATDGKDGACVLGARLVKAREEAALEPAWSDWEESDVDCVVRRRHRRMQDGSTQIEALLEGELQNLKISVEVTI